MATMQTFFKKIMTKNKTLLFILLLLFIAPLFSEDIHHNPWSLIIYRPENSSEINEVRCFLKIEDEQGNDVSKTAIRKVWYEWVNNTRVQYDYKNKLYLSGGMAMHLNIKPGIYKISFYTEPKDYEFVEYDFENKGLWTSNTLTYNTDNPTKVIFVYPTANDNGFYNGGWLLDYYAPDFFKFTKPLMEK